MPACPPPENAPPANPPAPTPLRPAFARPGAPRGTTVTANMFSSGGAALSIGWAVDSVRSTPVQSSPVCCITAA